MPASLPTNDVMVHVRDDSWFWAGNQLVGGGEVPDEGAIRRSDVPADGHLGRRVALGPDIELRDLRGRRTRSAIGRHQAGEVLLDGSLIRQRDGDPVADGQEWRGV